MIKSLICIMTALLLIVTPVYAQEISVIDSPEDSYIEEESTIGIPIVIDDSLELEVIDEDKPVLKDIEIIDNGDAYSIIKVYNALPEYDITRLEENFKKNGYEYQRGDIVEVSKNFEKQSKLASQTATLSHDNEDSTGVFNPLLEYDMDGYSGQLKIDNNSITTQASGEKS